MEARGNHVGRGSVLSLLRQICLSIANGSGNSFHNYTPPFDKTLRSVSESVVKTWRVVVVYQDPKVTSLCERVTPRQRDGTERRRIRLNGATASASTRTAFHSLVPSYLFAGGNRGGNGWPSTRGYNVTRKSRKTNLHATCERLSGTFLHCPARSYCTIEFLVGWLS